MSYLRSKDKKCHNRRKEGVVSRRKPMRAPDVCLDPIMCQGDEYIIGGKAFQCTETVCEHGEVTPNIVKKLGMKKFDITGAYADGATWRDDAKDLKESWLTRLLRKVGL